MHHVPDWHTYLDKKELLVKRILDVLENGGWGDARHLSNVLLPLLAHLPEDILTKDFYEAFFKAMFSGLDKKNIIHSKSERQSWITSLAECLRYLSIQQNDFVLEITTSVHRTWLAKVLSTVHDGQTRNNLIKCSATNMSSLVKYWLKQSKEENSEKYDQLVRNFWQNVGATVLTQIDKSSTDQKEIGSLIDGHILLLQTLKTTFAQPKKQQSIKFHGDEQTVPDKCAVEPQPCDAATADRYKHNLDDLVHKVCCHYFESAERKQISNAILTPLITLLVEFESKNLFTALSRQFDVDSIYKFYDKVLRSWLCGDTMRCKSVVDIIFLLMKYMSEEEQDSMFDSFTQFPPSVVEWCLSVCVRAPHVRAAAARRWARGREAARALQALATRAAAHADAAAAALLLLCLTGPAQEEPLASADAVAAVLRTVTAAVAEVGGAGEGEACAALAARLATALHDQPAAPHYAELVLQLFRLNVRVPRGDSRLSVDTWCEARSSWQDGAHALPPAARAALLRQAAAFLHEQLFLNIEKLDITKIENIVSPCPYLFNQSDDDEGPGDVTEIVAFIKQIFDIEDAESVIVESYALRHECVTSQLNSLYGDDSEAMAIVIREASNNNAKELIKRDLMLYVIKNLFRAIYLRTMLLHKTNSDDDEEETSEQKTWCDVLLTDEYFQNEFCKVLHTYVVINSLHEAYAFWPEYNIIVATKQKLDCLVTDVITAMSPSANLALQDVLSRRAAAGYLWPGARRLHGLRAALPEPDVPPTLQDTNLIPNGLFHTLQANMKWSSDEEAAYQTKFVVMVRSWCGAHGAGGGARRLAAELAACDLTPLIDDYYSRTHTMLYDMDISTTEWSVVVSNVAVVEFLTTMVASRGWDAPPHHWDFTTISLCSLLASVRKTMHLWASTKVSMLCRSVLRLWAALHTFVRSVRARSLRQQPAPHVADLLHEWQHMFAPDTTYSLLTIIMHVLDSCTESEMTSTQIEVIGELIACTKLIEWDTLPAAHKLGALSLARLARCAADVLQQPAHHAHKYLAYRLLLALAKPLVLDDAEKLSLWSEESLGEGDEEKERPQFSLDHFHDAFTHLHEIIEAALSTVVLGEGTCEFVAMSDSYSMALGWLLLADVMAELSELARGDLTHHYVQIYRECKYAEPLVTAALRLLPDAVFAFAADHTGNASPPTQYSDMFLKVKDFSVHEPATGSDIGALACRCIYTVVCGAGGGGARGWWGAAAPRRARLLEAVVRAYVAPHAARHQLQALHSRRAELEDTEIHIAWSSNEVTCIYTVEERAIELRVWLAPAHPLAAPRLAAPHAAGPGSNTHWLALYLAYQNGTLLNALKMWTAAVSAKVESAPQCYICYCRLQPASGRLPKVPCHQCRNKFHNLCLRKWFATSNKSSCPLCRSAF